MYGMAEGVWRAERDSEAADTGWIALVPELIHSLPNSQARPRHPG
jgi:hypothetical protein